jgi:hypothetical protein
MKRLLALSGGQPLKAEDWVVIQNAARDSVNALVKGLSGISTPCIVYGMEVSYPGANIALSAGVFFDGEELCYVPAAQFTYNGELPDSPGSVGWRLFLEKNETTSESRAFKDNTSKNIYQVRDYAAVYDDTQPSGALELPPRMMDLVASFVAPLVPIPTSPVSYLKKSFTSASLDQARPLLPEPGVGRAIQIISLSAQISPTSQLDVGTQTLRVFYGTDYQEDIIGDFPNSFIEQSSQGLYLLSLGNNLEINKSICLAFSSLDAPIEGSAVFYIHIIYKIITL